MGNILENKELVKVFAMYLGNEVIFDNDDETTGEEYLYSVQISGCGDTNMNEWDSISNPISLKLNSLSSLTEEHLIDIAKIYGGLWAKLDDNFLQVINKENEVVRYFILTQELPHKMYQYLISKGYAVPLFFDVNHWANGKTAIELGIAIEKI